MSRGMQPLQTSARDSEIFSAPCFSFPHIASAIAKAKWREVRSDRPFSSLPEEYRFSSLSRSTAVRGKAGGWVGGTVVCDERGVQGTSRATAISENRLPWPSVCVCPSATCESFSCENREVSGEGTMQRISDDIPNRRASCR
jgi:hypothetical protein